MTGRTGIQARRQAGRQAGRRETFRETWDSKTGRQKDMRQWYSYAGRQGDGRHGDRETVRQGDRETGRQWDRETVRQWDRETGDRDTWDVWQGGGGGEVVVVMRGSVVKPEPPFLAGTGAVKKGRLRLQLQLQLWPVLKEKKEEKKFEQ